MSPWDTAFTAAPQVEQTDGIPALRPQRSWEIQGIAVVVFFMVPNFCCVELCRGREDHVYMVLIHSAPSSLSLYAKTSDCSKSQVQEEHSCCF